MFYPIRSVIAGDTAIAKILDKPRIVRGEAPELGPRHPGLSQKTFDL